MTSSSPIVPLSASFTADRANTVETKGTKARGQKLADQQAQQAHTMAETSGRVKQTKSERAVKLCFAAKVPRHPVAIGSLLPPACGGASCYITPDPQLMSSDKGKM